LTWALATGSRYSIARSSEPRTTSGARRPSRASSAAPHPRQRLDYPVHRAAADRLVAVERPLAAGLAGEPPRGQPQQRARVADVDRRRPGATQSGAIDHELGALGLDPRPERRDSIERGAGVGRLEVVGDPRPALPHRGDDRGPVGDRLVRGRDDRAAQRARRFEANDAHRPGSRTETT
jgi:hypothetical protein